ncbi:MAG: terminase family protein [Saprospiraceae bacterium]|nr:terminase family protein [Saprospiraceae bacterium]
MNRPIYWNSKQLKFLQATQKRKMFLGGRGAGKTTVEGGEQYIFATQMPRSKGFLSSTTYNQLLTKTLPSLMSKWRQMGMEKYEDYVVGTRPPKSWERSIEEPEKYENIISFSNGRRIELLSMDRPDLARGGSFTDGAVDEAALVPLEHVTRVLLPSIRLGRFDFGDHPRWGSFRGYTSIPWKPSGYWTMDYEEKAKAFPDKYAFIEANAYDNVLVLGEEYIQMLQDELPYLEFLVEVMNQRIRKVRDAFYHKFDADKHSYTVRYLYGLGESGIITNGIADPHYDRTGALDFSFDFSGWFNCAIAFQDGWDTTGGVKRLVEYGLHQFFVKQEDGKVGELVDKICEHYKDHKNKVARLWGEPRGHDPKPDTPETLFQQIQKRFVRNGWRVEIRVKPGQVKAHKERNFYMNDLLAENTTLPALRLNDQTCKDAIIAMQVTSVKADYQKDKSLESKRDFPQEQATHFTDLIDYYFMQKHGWRVSQKGNRPALSAGVR